MEILFIILILAVAGPVIGSAIGVLKKPSHLFLNNMLAFAAGVMLTISFLELIPHSISTSSASICVLGIILGAVFMYALDRLLPHIHPEMCSQEQGYNLKRTAFYLITGIFMHNFPEGMAIAIGTVTNANTALTIALAIAIHNIPEGICTSAPYYYCTKKKLKSFLISSSTAIPIVLGFFFAKMLFARITLDFVGLIAAATAGIMIYISADELIPQSCNKNMKAWNHSAIFSLIAGIIFVVLLGTI